MTFPRIEQAVSMLGALRRSMTALACAAVVPLSLAGMPTAHADELDDVLKSDTERDSTTKAERDAVKKGDDAKVVLPGESNSKRIIQTRQKKNFLKLGRYEGGVHLGFVTNDPFINRYMVGGNIAYHLTELLAIEGHFTFSPDFGKGDWRPITTQLVENNRVSPDISKIFLLGDINLQFSPIYGKIAVQGGNIINFDIFGTFGTGVVNTHDDLVALQAEDDPAAQKTQIQWHPTTNIGGGFRINFTKNFALRLEGRTAIYIETISSTTLEMKNNFMLLGGASFFFPNMKE
jgi:outer membrane beta-barrel protein